MEAPPFVSRQRGRRLKVAAFAAKAIHRGLGLLHQGRAISTRRSSFHNSLSRRCNSSIRARTSSFALAVCSDEGSNSPPRPSEYRLPADPHGAGQLALPQRTADQPAQELQLGGIEPLHPLIPVRRRRLRRLRFAIDTENGTMDIVFNSRQSRTIGHFCCKIATLPRNFKPGACNCRRPRCTL